ncbi:hypothetical protein B0H66DRAFT_595459 [Apodospora peruviana]|uniref:Uncharacterized protein n=1 Tax=Apodospora peruviana TaxID=516989 RepID=A0AAE0LZ37_9PEZI|nr:hypothetical protein B0H66DRAFT_595459 [Apodospora peruviana]
MHLHNPLLPAISGLFLLTASVTSAPVTPPAPNNVQQFVGKGKIAAVAGSFFDSDDALIDSQKVGCLNAAGVLTLDDCAVFSRSDSYPNTLSTSAGDCTFHNTRMPLNTDSFYGQTSHAWYCGELDDAHRENLAELKDPAAPQETYYTVEGFTKPYLCTGEFGCYFDVKKAPTSNEDAIPVWQYFWGGSQMGITPGHLRIVWLWVPVGKGEKSSA